MTAANWNLGPLGVVLVMLAVAAVGATLLIGPFLLLRKRGNRAALAGAIIGALCLGVIVLVAAEVADSRARRAMVLRQAKEMQERDAREMRRVFAQVFGDGSQCEVEASSDVSVNSQRVRGRTPAASGGVPVGQAATPAESERGPDADQSTARAWSDRADFPPHPGFPGIDAPRSVDSPQPHRRVLASPVVRVGGLVVLLLLAYLFIDAGRRPRYTWVWRVGIAVVFFAVCGLLAGGRYAL